MQVVTKGATRGGKRDEVTSLTRSKLRKKLRIFNFEPILCIQPHQNVNATLSYPPSYLILLHFSSKIKAILVKILDILNLFSLGDPKLRDFSNLWSYKSITT